VNNRDYVLTSGHSDNCFDHWVKTQTPPLKPNADLYISAAKNCYRRHDYEAAITEYQRAIMTDPHNAEAYGLMGYSYFRLAQLDDAEKALNHSLQYDPTDLMTYYNRALVEWAKKDPLQALADITTIYQKDLSYRARFEKDCFFGMEHPGSCTSIKRSLIIPFWALVRSWGWVWVVRFLY